jgi:hypothetical protein
MQKSGIYSGLERNGYSLGPNLYSAQKGHYFHSVLYAIKKVHLEEAP